MASTKFINECKNDANSNRLGKISVETIKKVSGTKLELSKTLDKKISPKLYGITKQNVYSGKNLYVSSSDIPTGYYSGGVKDVENTHDGDISIKTANAWAGVYFNLKELISNNNLKIGDKVTCSIFFKTNFIPTKALSFTAYRFTSASGNHNIIIPIEEIIVGEWKRLSFEFQINEFTLTAERGRFEANYYVSDDPYYFGNNRKNAIWFASPQFEVGELTDYEPYVGGKASPSPDYPQEIEVATGSVSVKSTGKNLYSGGDVSGIRTVTVNIETISAGTYTLSAVATSNDTDSNTCLIYDNTNSKVLGKLERNARKSITITLENPTSKLTFYASDLNTNSTDDTFSFKDIQIEKSEVATDYEPYKESSITYDLGDNFLAEQDYIENGVLNKKIGKVVLDGSDDEGWSKDPNVDNAVDYFWIKNIGIDKNNINTAISNRFILGTSLTQGMWATFVFCITIDKKYTGITSSDTKEQRINKFKTWLSENPVTVYYELATPEQIQLETTGELRTFEPNTIITNSLDSEMEVEYSSWDTEITNSDNLTDVSIEDSCYVDGQIIGTTYAKKATSQLIAIPNDVDLLDKKIKVEIGVKYADLSNEMIKMGNYTIERPKDEQTENFTQITAYDGFNLLDNPYVCNLDFSNDITIADFYIDVCNQLKLSPMKTTFLNSDIKVTANPFVNKETLRVVLQEIEKVSCTFSEIDYETNKIDLVWLSENEEPDYEFATSDYTTLEGGKITYGPVNCLVIKESQIEGENTVRQDDDSIKTNGETQIAIQDSYFLFTQALREQAIDNIWNRVKGLTYVDCKLTTSYGKPFLKVGKKIRVNVNDGRVFDTYVLKHTFKYDGTFESIIESPALTKQETKVKSKSISESIRLTEIRVDKAEGNIIATTKKTQEIMDNLNNNYYTIEQANTLIQNAETGVTNTFSEAGGNNILRNTGLWFESNDTDNPYEFWLGNVKKGKNDNAVGYNSMLLQNGTLEQEQEVPNGDYSISFYYQKLNQLCNASVVINDVEYPLESMEVKQFYTGEKDNETGEYIVQPIVVSSNHINIKFKCDADNGVEVYDLMCNKGTVKLAYSQNQNETTTDTVNISKGITITSSNDENVKFKADYDGIRTLNKNGDVKTKFTDKGMETDEAIIRYKEQTCGTLIQEVDGQTWFTRM